MGDKGNCDQTQVAKLIIRRLTGRTVVIEGNRFIVTQAQMDENPLMIELVLVGTGIMVIRDA